MHSTHPPFEVPDLDLPVRAAPKAVAEGPAPTWRVSTPSVYAEPALEGPLAALATLPMGLWKRVATYPLVALVITNILFPCRSSGTMNVMLAVLCVAGAIGAWARWHLHDRALYDDAQRRS